MDKDGTKSDTVGDGIYIEETENQALWYKHTKACKHMLQFWMFQSTGEKAINN